MCTHRGLLVLVRGRRTPCALRRKKVSNKSQSQKEKEKEKEGWSLVVARVVVVVVFINTVLRS